MSAGLQLFNFPRLARSLLLGEGAAAVIEAAGMVAPALFQISANAACEVIQIAPRQFLLSALPTQLDALPMLAGPGVLELPTEYDEFAIVGADWAALLPAITTANSAAPGATRWFTTQVCGLDAAIVREANGFRVLCAPAEGPWLACALEAQVRARGGSLITFEDYLGLAARD